MKNKNALIGYTGFIGSNLINFKKNIRAKPFPPMAAFREVSQKTKKTSLRPLLLAWAVVP